jgi:hypothetical protein
MAVCLLYRHRCLAVLGSSYRKISKISYLAALPIAESSARQISLVVS